MDPALIYPAGSSLPIGLSSLMDNFAPDGSPSESPDMTAGGCTPPLSMHRPGCFIIGFKLLRD